MYHKLAGMTGTAETEAGEFWEIYKLDVVVIPTNKPITRSDINDVIYRSKREKYNALVDQITTLKNQGRPVLVGTTSVDVSEVVSRMLKRKGIKHNVLNAKQHKSEAEIVAAAGEPGTVTVATNMAGRGTDIKLGSGVKENGGLAILGTERHESRRIDRQLRGRSGRQGDPGSSVFFLSLEDDLLRLFRSDRIAGIMDRLGAEEGEVITHSMITRSIENAQKKVESQNFAIRKRLLEYDDVMNQQREIIYDRRRVALMEKDSQKEILDILDEYIEFKVNELYNNFGADLDIEILEAEIGNTIYVSFSKIKDDIEHIEPEKLKDFIKEEAVKIYEAKERIVGSEQLRVFERYFILRVIDEQWKDHLYEMDMLKEGIHLRAYGQKNPLIEYKREAFGMFEALIHSINGNILKWLWKIQVETGPLNREEARKNQRMNMVHEPSAGMGFQVASVGEESDIQRASKERSNKKQPIRVEKKTKPNEPCPCGSGKKYKKCHGAA
jgi:preprotein translocase subunit SecA